MIFKRFKTLLFKYIDADPRVSSSTQYVLYLDINNVISNPLDVFFGDYHNKVNDELQKSGVTTNLFNHSYISFWVNPVKERDHFQGGQFMVHQNNGRGCLDAWRHQMDTVPMEMDQPLLMNVVKNPEEYLCIASLLPNENPKEKHFNMLQPNIIKSPEDEYPTIVHINGYQARIFSEIDQRYFLRKALMLEPGNVHGPSVGPNMIGDI